MKKIEFSEKDIEDMIEMRKSGYTLGQIAKKYYVSRQLISRETSRHLPTKGRVAVKENEIIEMYNNGCTITEIAEKCEAARSTIHNILKDKVQLRGKYLPERFVESFIKDWNNNIPIQVIATTYGMTNERSVYSKAHMLRKQGYEVRERDKRKKSKNIPEEMMWTFILFHWNQGYGDEYICNKMNIDKGELDKIVGEIEDSGWHIRDGLARDVALAKMRSMRRAGMERVWHVNQKA